MRAKQITRPSHLLAVGCALLTLGSLPMRALAGITAMVEPARVSEGEWARLTVTLTGSSVSEPVLPTIQGLRFRSAGQSSHMQIVNGSVSSSRSYTYLLQGDDPGTYAIPSIRARIDGAVQASEPVSIQVIGGSGTPGTAGRLSPPASAIAPPSRPSAMESDVAFLRVQASKTNPYVGELVPVQVKAYVREGIQASLNAMPEIQGTAFTLQSLEERPQRSREMIGNHVYSVLTWYTGMSAIKDGSFSVSAQLDLTVQVPEPRRSRNRRAGGPFDGSIFDGFFDEDMFAGFFGRVREEQVTLSSDEEAFDVLPLPKEGRPANFSGAVGSFDLTAEATPEHLTLGDPVSIRATVTGFGNFDRVSAPEFRDATGLKTYEPTSEFRARDTVGYEGIKTFEQAAIPQDGSLTEIPPLELSFFDPERGHYKTVVSAAIPVRITGDVAPPASAHTEAPALARPDPSDPPPPESPLLQHELGSLGRGLQPLVFQPWFVGMQSVPLAALFAGILLLRKQKRNEANPDLAVVRQAKRDIALAMAAMSRAIRQDDVPGFFRACRSAVQAHLASRWHVEPMAITLADVRQRLPEATNIHQIFAAADAATYSGETYTRAELIDFRRRLNLTALETQS